MSGALLILETQEVAIRAVGGFTSLEIRADRTAPIALGTPIANRVARIFRSERSGMHRRPTRAVTPRALLGGLFRVRRTVARSPRTIALVAIHGA